MISLRPYQLDAVERVRVALRSGSRRVLIALPTGGGKTVIAAHLITQSVARGRRVLFIAHRRELIQQCYRKLLEAGIEERAIGVLMAGDPRRRPGAEVQVASIDTLRHRAKPLADLVIVDEAHRALAKSYRDVAAGYPSAVHLGLSATPYRADGQGLGDAYDDLVVVATAAELIAQGFLVEPRVFTVSASDLPDLSEVRVRRGDYDERALAAAVDKQPLVGNIVEHWQRLAGERRTVAFAVSVEHSRHIAERFRKAGVAAEHLDGATTPLERDAILRRLERGETRVVSNCGVLCEGWDQPAVKCCILARPTKSVGLYLQQAGRILRPWRDVSGDPVSAVVLDHAGCAMAHGLPHDDRELSLETREKRRGKKAPMPPRAKICGGCQMAIAPATRTCGGCGFSLRAVEGVPGEKTATLVEVPAAPLDEKRAAWDALCAKASRLSLTRQWALARYRERFGAAPSTAYERPALGAKDDARVATPEAPSTPSSSELVEWDI